MKKRRIRKMLGAAALTAVISAAVVPTSAFADVLVPTPGGTQYSNGKAVIDYSNVSQGYLMVKYNGSSSKMKVQVTKNGIQYLYDLNAADRYEVFPCSEGNGTYSVKVFEQVSGNQYAQVASQDINVNLANPNLPFLYPNQYVNFNAGNAAVAKAAQLAGGCGNQLGIVSAVFNYVQHYVSYDNAKAATVQSGYLPNVDETLATGKGICFDYASLMTAMLRSQGIPTKLVIGYTDNMYHAWVSVYTDEQGWLEDFIYFDGHTWKYADPTFMSTGGGSAAVKEHVANAANYQAKFSY